jgi:hypothetical protein
MTVNMIQSRVWFRLLSILFFGICALMCRNPELLAQDANRQEYVTIEVKDQSGAPISNAQIEVLPSHDETATKLSTDGNGELSIRLSSGSYELLVTSAGFRNAARHLEVQKTGRQLLTFVLEVGGCRPGACLTVTAIPPSQNGEKHQSETHGIEFHSVKLLSWQGIGQMRKYTEFDELRKREIFTSSRPRGSM